MVRFTLLPALIIAAGSGCVMLEKLRVGGSETPESQARAARWDGPECKRALYQLDELDGYDYNAKDTVEDPAPEAQVLLAVCARKQKMGYADHVIPQHPRIKELGLEATYYTQDDWKLDVLSAALFAVHESELRNKDHAEMYLNKAEVGLALFWTQVITAEDVERALATVNVPPGARSAMVALYRAVPDRLAGLLDADDTAVYVTTAFEVFKARKDHYATYHKQYEQLEKLRAEAEATRDDTKHIDRVASELQHLRSDFFAACGKIECRTAPLYANATRELAQLYVLRGNVLAARVESSLFAREGSYIAGLPQAIRAAQTARVQKLSEGWEKYRKAKDNGSDDKTARRLAGEVPAERPDFRLLEPALKLPNYAAAIEKDREGGGSSNAFVERVSGGGTSRTVVFKTDKIDSSESYDCVQTNRVIRINTDGTLEYEENCKSRPVTYRQLQHEPITLPAEEATGIRHGDLVVFMTQGEKSMVLEVKRGDQTVQVRGDRVPAR